MHTLKRDEQEKSGSWRALRGLKSKSPGWRQATLLLWLTAFVLVGTALGIGVRASAGKSKA